MIFRRPLFCAGGLAKVLVFKTLPGAAVLIANRSFGLQALGAAPAEKLPVLEPIRPAPIQSRCFGRAGITGFGSLSHSYSTIGLGGLAVQVSAISERRNGNVCGHQRGNSPIYVGYRFEVLPSHTK